MINTFLQHIANGVNGVVKLITPEYVMNCTKYNSSNLLDMYYYHNSRILLFNFMEYLLNKENIERLFFITGDYITHFRGENKIFGFCNNEKMVAYVTEDHKPGAKIHINDLTDEDLNVILEYLNKFPLVIFKSHKMTKPDGTIDEYSAFMCKGRL